MWCHQANVIAMGIEKHISFLHQLQYTLCGVDGFSLITQISNHHDCDVISPHFYEHYYIISF